MNIAFFSNSYLPYLSGITLSIKSFRQELQKLGHQVWVIGPWYPKHKDTDHQVIRLVSLPAAYPGYRLVIPFSFSLRAKLKKIKVELIHTHQPFGVGLLALVLAKTLQAPIVYTFHTLFTRYLHNIPFIPQKLSKIIVAAYLTFFCQQVDIVIVPSEMVRRWLVLRKVKKPIVVIPTGINIQEIKNQTIKQADWKFKVREEHNLPLDAKLLLYTGRIAEEKNIPFLLKTFALIQAQEKNVYLLLVGGGPKEQEYQAIAAKISQQIIFTGPKTHTQVLEYCLAADLFVYASRTETQGLVLCEAKACGLPIVAVFGGGLVDVVESGLDGYLVPQNQDKFVEHVLRLLRDNELRAKMSHQARRDAEERFSSTIVAKQLESVYNSLIPKRRNP